MTTELPEKDSDEEYEADRQRRKYRQARRRARERAGEIKDLNITAMMDMMTILLVFLLKSYSASSTNLQLTAELQIPRSSTLQGPQDYITLTVTASEVLVGDLKVVPVENGVIPASFHDGAAAANPLVPKLLAGLQAEVDKQKEIAKFNPKWPFTGRINVIADKRIPYQTVLAILYTAGQAELAQYKLMALKSE